LPLAALVASVLAAPLPKDCTTEIHGNQVIEIYDVTITSTVYVTASAQPTTSSVPAYVPEPAPTVVYVPPPPPPTITPTPTPVYEPVYIAPVVEQPKPSPKPAPAPPPVSEATGDDAKCLEAHNRFRSAHGAPALRWSQELADYAKQNTQSCQMQHTGGPYGENLAFGYSDVVSAVTGWYNEKDQYNYNSPGFQGSTGHFSQVIWKATSELGCYFRDCNGRGYLMCEYRTPGNVMGDNGRYFRENVQ